MRPPPFDPDRDLVEQRKVGGRALDAAVAVLVFLTAFVWIIGGC